MCWGEQPDPPPVAPEALQPPESPARAARRVPAERFSEHPRRRRQKGHREGREPRRPISTPAASLRGAQGQDGPGGSPLASKSRCRGQARTYRARSRGSGAAVGPCPGPVPAGERLSPPRGRRREKPGLAELLKRGTKRRAAFAINNAAERSLQLLSERERGGGQSSSQPRSSGLKEEAGA